MRSNITGIGESMPWGITPCARGDSLLKTLAEAGKVAVGSDGVRQLFSPGSASMFSPTDFRLVKLFEVRRNQ
jgi:hypothetical protein